MSMKTTAILPALLLALGMLAACTERRAPADPREQDLATAVVENDVERVKQLLREGVDPNATIGTDTPFPDTQATFSVLGYAVQWRHHEVALALIDAGADVEVGQIHESGSPSRPLGPAAASGNEELVRALLDAGADVEGRGAVTPLRKAAGRGHKDIVILLLERGADVNAGQTTPVWVAARGGHRDVIELLLAEGADLDVESAGFTPEEIARHQGHDDVADWLAEQRESQPQDE